MFPYFQSQGKTAERPHLNLPEGSYEEEFGLEGFYGPVSHLYHQHPLTDWSSIQKSQFQWPTREEAPAEFLKPQSFDPLEPRESADMFSSAYPLFFNDDIQIWVHPVSEESHTYFRNADASELYFCHRGKLELQSPFGRLAVTAGDYMVIPKGLAYRWKVQEAAYLLRMETFGSFWQKPETGIMGQQALYHEQVIQTPILDSGDENESRILVQKEDVLTEIVYPFDIRDVVGWCGNLYPFVLSMDSIAPAMSPTAHLPPSINSTFLTDHFVVCSFLPRPLEEPEGALKVPFFHSNIDYDEVIFYHDGDFFSRDGIDQGMITLHPRGIHHGPHPKALKEQHRMKRTQEKAVMIDTRKPLKRTQWAQQMENPEYWRSWMS